MLEISSPNLNAFFCHVLLLQKSWHHVWYYFIPWVVVSSKKMAGDPQYCLRLSLFMESAHNIWYMEKGRAVKRMKAVPLDVVVRSHWSMSLMGAKYFRIFVLDGINVFFFFLKKKRKREKFSRNYFLKEQTVQEIACYISEHWQCQSFCKDLHSVSLHCCFKPQRTLCVSKLIRRFWPHKWYWHSLHYLPPVLMFS